MSAGHYVSSVKDRATGKWYCFNDNILTPTSEKEVVSESAYMLFYVRKDMAGVNIDDVYPAVERAGMDTEEVAKMMKRRDRSCSLS
jgi:hypothetical protein